MPKPKSPPETVGLHALIEQLRLPIPRPAVRSELTSTARRSRVSDTAVVESFPEKYRQTIPADPVLANVKFALKYEPIDLGVYAALFEVLDKRSIEDWVKFEPNGVYARRAWYLYELLTARQLSVPDLTSGPYAVLLDEDLHFTGSRQRIPRQRIFDNLVGTKHYCPLIRRTQRLQERIVERLQERARHVVADVDPALMRRAVSYLYTKETKSSFAIEGERPSKDRSERFINALARAEQFDVLSKPAFIQLQNTIVDPRYQERDWRYEQVFVGETLPDFSEHVHYVCPKPQDVPGLLSGWMEMVSRATDPQAAADPVCAAAAAAFGFVYIHPFVDGNGRIHRFLVHHILAKTGFTPEQLVFPISAAMLRNMRSYDHVLEQGSRAIHPFIDYWLDESGRMTVRNDTARLYRYFDATPHAEYLFACIADTIENDLPQEISFLKFFDAALTAVLKIVDMPNRRASLLIQLIEQNGGKLAGRRRNDFAEITNEELAAIEEAVMRNRKARGRDAD